VRPRTAEAPEAGKTGRAGEKEKKEKKTRVEFTFLRACVCAVVKLLNFSNNLLKKNEKRKLTEEEKNPRG
jgi:hypothetical protein